MFQLSLSDGYQRPVSIADSLLALSDASLCMRLGYSMEKWLGICIVW